MSSQSYEQGRSSRLMLKSEGEQVVDEKKVIKDCAYLALKSHVYKDTSYHGHSASLIKVMQVEKKSLPGGGADYSIIFKGHTETKGVEVFQVVVFQDLVHRKVIRTRALDEDEWYDGEFAVPLISVERPQPTSLDVPVPTNWFTGKYPSPQIGFGMPKPTSLDVPTPSPSDVIAKQKLNKERRRIAESCAVLALQDYAIQVSTGGLRFIKLVKADAVRRTYGLVYTVVFKAATDMTGVAIFVGTVWDTNSMRKVLHVRTVRPHLGEWYTGILEIPLEKVLDLSQFQPSGC